MTATWRRETALQFSNLSDEREEKPQMIPTSNILKRIGENSQTHKDGVYTRLYRYLLREDIYYTAYKNLYANNGAGTKGIDDDTADGFGKSYISKIIEELASLKYEPKPVRRKSIPKKNSDKKRPLGIPSFRDKLVQEVIRMFLEAIYEPNFSDNSHGFRPERSCHTALKQAKCTFTGAKWFIEGDIKGCFDNIDHAVLLYILSKKIKDSKFINLVGKFLKAGYMEDWVYHNSRSGTPQGGIISPILANIYLSELDRKIEEIKRDFDKPRERETTVEYSKCNYRINYIRQILKKPNLAEERKAELITELGIKRKELLTLPSKDCSDKNIAYVRYADDFLIGVKGTKAECEQIKTILKDFLSDELKLELSIEKTKITHSSKSVRFLGYDVSVRRNTQLKRKSNGVVTRTLNGTVELCIPLQDKIERFIIDNGIARKDKDGKFLIQHRTDILNNTDLEILNSYNAKTRGICNYYRIASNFNTLGYFVYLMEYSCLKTLARKHKTTVAQVRGKLACDKSWGVTYETKDGRKTAMIVTLAKLRKEKLYTSEIDIIRKPWLDFSRRNEIAERLEKSVCELCGAENVEVVVHHTTSVKNLQGNEEWKRIMKEKRRKTLIVCEKCHSEIHKRSN